MDTNSADRLKSLLRPDAITRSLESLENAPPQTTPWKESQVSKWKQNNIIWNVTLLSVISPEALRTIPVVQQLTGDKNRSLAITMEQGSGAARWAGIFRIEDMWQRGAAQLSKCCPEQFLAFVCLNLTITTNRSIIKEVSFKPRMGCWWHLGIVTAETAHNLQITHWPSGLILENASRQTTSW